MNEKIDFDFNVPQYIIDELDEYIQDVKNGKYRYMKLENIKALTGLARLNNRITKEQGDYILEKIQQI